MKTDPFHWSNFMKTDPVHWSYFMTDPILWLNMKMTVTTHAIFVNQNSPVFLA